MLQQLRSPLGGMGKNYKEPFDGLVGKLHESNANLGGMSKAQPVLNDLARKVMSS